MGGTKVAMLRLNIETWPVTWGTCRSGFSRGPMQCVIESDRHTSFPESHIDSRADDTMAGRLLANIRTVSRQEIHKYHLVQHYTRGTRPDQWRTCTGVLHLQVKVCDIVTSRNRKIVNLLDR